MTATINPRHYPHPRPDPEMHRFAVGQAVRLKGGFGTQASTIDIFHITATLPARGNSPQYRIRNDNEPHERVTTQESLEAVPAARADDTAELIEKTFGNGHEPGPGSPDIGMLKKPGAQHDPESDFRELVGLAADADILSPESLDRGPAPGSEFGRE